MTWKEYAIGLVKWQIQKNVTANPYTQLLLSEHMRNGELIATTGITNILEIGDVRFPVILIKLEDEIVCTTTNVCIRIGLLEISFVVRPIMQWLSTYQIDEIIGQNTRICDATYDISGEVHEQYFKRLVNDVDVRRLFLQQSYQDFSDVTEFVQLEIPSSYEIPVCSVCTCDISKDLERLICGHTFHFNCINEWFGITNGNGGCPICRHDMKYGIERK